MSHSGVSLYADLMKWECDLCYADNMPEATKCIKCSNERNESTSDLIMRSPTRPINGMPSPRNLKAQQEPWRCQTCLVMNEAKNTKCICCELPPDYSSAEASTAPKKSSIFREVPDSVVQTLGDMKTSSFFQSQSDDSTQASFPIFNFGISPNESTKLLSASSPKTNLLGRIGHDKENIFDFKLSSFQSESESSNRVRSPLAFDVAFFPPSSEHSFGTPNTHGTQKESFSQQPLSPTRHSQSPVKQRQSPTRHQQSPTGQPHSPIRQPHSPIRQPHSPIRQLHSPVKQPRSPIRQPQSPIKQAQSMIKLGGSSILKCESLIIESQSVNSYSQGSEASQNLSDNFSTNPQSPKAQPQSPTTCYKSPKMHPERISKALMSNSDKKRFRRSSANETILLYSPKRQRTYEDEGMEMVDATDEYVNSFEQRTSTDQADITTFDDDFVLPKPVTSVRSPTYSTALLESEQYEDALLTPPRESPVQKLNITIPTKEKHEVSSAYPPDATPVNDTSQKENAYRFSFGVDEILKNMPTKDQSAMLSSSGASVSSVATPTFGSLNALKPKNEILSNKLLHGLTYTWGSCDCDQLAVNPKELNDFGAMAVPYKIKEFEKGKVVQIACGSLHSATVMSDGSLMTWGCNDDGALGRILKPTEKERFPGRVTGLLLRQFVVSVACGDSHTIALTTQGTCYLWGSYRDSSGSIGFPDFHNNKCIPKATEPVLIQPLKQWTCLRVVAGDNHTGVFCISKNTNTPTSHLFLLGSNEFGQLGLPITQDREMLLFPHEVVKAPWTEKQKITNVFCGRATTFVEAREGDLQDVYYYGVGRNACGELGIQKDDPCIHIWTEILDFRHIQLLTLISAQFCSIALDTEGNCYTWGKREFLGHDAIHTSTQLRPLLHPYLSGVDIIGTGSDTLFAFQRSSNRIAAWGEGQMYQIGDGFDYEEHVILPKWIDCSEHFENGELLEICGGSQHSLALVSQGDAVRDSKQWILSKLLSKHSAKLFARPPKFGQVMWAILCSQDAQGTREAANKRKIKHTTKADTRPQKIARHTAANEKTPSLKTKGEKQQLNEVKAGKIKVEKAKDVKVISEKPKPKSVTKQQEKAPGISRSRSASLQNVSKQPTLTKSTKTTPSKDSKSSAATRGKSTAMDKEKSTTTTKGKSIATTKGKSTTTTKGKSIATTKGKSTATTKGKSNATDKGKETATAKRKASETEKNKLTAPKLNEKNSSQAETKLKTGGKAQQSRTASASKAATVKGAKENKKMVDKVKPKSIKKKSSSTKERKSRESLEKPDTKISSTVLSSEVKPLKSSLKKSNVINAVPVNKKTSFKVSVVKKETF